MRLQAVLFDLDDTLVVDEAVSREALEATAQQAARQHGVDQARFSLDAARLAKTHWLAGPCHDYCRAIGISAFECLWGNFEGDSPDLLRLKAWSRDFRVQVFDAALREQLIESPDGVPELAQEFCHQRRALQRLMPNARETLARLASEYALGMLTNGAPDLQREKIAASGLAEFFKAIAVSGEKGIGKPRPEIFHDLVRELGAKPAGAVMVGNSLERDIAGARNAGLISIWLQVSGSEEFAEAAPDSTILDLSELPALLNTLEERQPLGENTA